MAGLPECNQKGYYFSCRVYLIIYLDALRAALANTGALVREKFFTKKTVVVNPTDAESENLKNRTSVMETRSIASSINVLDERSSVASSGSGRKMKKAMGALKRQLTSTVKNLSNPSSTASTTTLIRNPSSASTKSEPPALPPRSINSSGGSPQKGSDTFSPSPIGSGLHLDETSSDFDIIQPLSGRSTPNFPQEILTLSQKAKIFFGKSFPDVVMPSTSEEEF